MRSEGIYAVLLVALLGTGSAVQESAAGETGVRVFEMRTYTTPPGKLDDLHERFREHTMKFFERHGMTNVAYWTPQDPKLADTTLVYVLSHESREAATANWKAFSADPEWQRVRAASEANGPIVMKVESVFLEATDYSPMK